MVFFFFLLEVANVLQLPTRCSLLATWKMGKRNLSDKCTERTFPSSIFFDFPLPRVDLFLFLPCFKSFIGQIHFDGSTNGVRSRQGEYRGQTTYLRRRTSSSINSSLALILSCCLKGGVRVFNRKSESSIVVGKFKVFKTMTRPCFTMASSSSRLVLSESSDSAC